MFKHLRTLLLIAALCLPWVTKAQDCTQTVPFSENFENYAGVAYNATSGRILPTCWNGFTTVPNYIPCVVSGTGSYVYTHGGKSMAMTGGTVSTYGMNKYVLLPPLDEPLNQLQLNFWMCTEQSSSTYGTLHVGYVTSDDTTTFVSIASYPSSAATVHSGNGPQSDGVGLEVELLLSQVPDSATRLAFKWEHSNSSYHTCCIDDILVAYPPTCPKPLSMSFSDVTSSSVTVSWVPAGSESQWEIVYDNQTAYSNDTFYSISGLNANTSYNFSVRAICAVDDTSLATTSSVSTTCIGIDSLPYFENFDGVSGATSTSVAVNNLPNCWFNHNVGTSTSYSGYPIVYNSSSYAHSGSQAMRFYTYITAGTYSDQYAIMPITDPDLYPVNTLKVNFWIRSTSTSYSSYCIVGVMTNPSDASSFVPVQTVQTNSSTTYVNHDVFLNAYTGPHGCVAFKVPQPSSSYNALLIDDITIDLMPTCPPPFDLTATNVTADSIAISWHPGGDESTWIVSNGDDEYVVSDTTFVFDNLNSSTGYNISVRALCSVDDTSTAVSMTIYTACVYASLPIIEDFDGITGSTATSPVPAGYLPPCWDIYNDGTRTNYQYAPYVYNSTTYSHSGNNCIRFYSFNSSGDSNQYLILPALDSNEYMVSDLQLTFWLRANSTSSGYFANVVVGVMTDPLVESSFIPYDTVNSTGSTSYSYHEINFNHYTGPQGRITLLFPKPLSSSQYEYGYLDDLMLGPIPTCISVDNLTSVYTASDTIILSWVPGGTETEWEVTYGTNSIVVNDTFCVVSQLSPNTEYTFNVRAICSVGDTSYPVSYSTRTDCGAITVLPYFESFEGLPAGSSSSLDCGIPCYGRLDNAGQYHFGYIGSPSSWPTGGHTGSGFVYYYMPTTANTYADWIITILPAVDISVYPLNTLQVSFWVKMNSATTSGDIQVGVITNTNDATTFVPLDTVHVAGNTFDLKTAYLSDWVDSNNTNASHIALKYFRDPSTTTYYFLDDVTIELIPDCPPVSNINVTGITSDSLYVTWSENGSATSWNVEYGPSGFTFGTGTTDVVTTLPYGIGNLTANTAYDVYVTPECNGGTSATRMGTFLTGCTPFSVPFTESFDTWSSTAADPLPNCWEKHTDYSTNYPYASTSYSHNGSGKSMYMYSTSTTYSYMVLPQFDLPIDSTMISFWLYKTNTSYAHKLLVGVMTNPADISTFVQVAEVAPSALSTWEQFEVPFSSYNGTGTRIAIMSPSTEYSYPYLDDLSVNVISGCQRVVDLSAANVLLDSATIVWADGINTSWFVEYDTVDFTPGVGNGHNLTMVTDTFCVLTGLDSGTVYHVYVYPDCDTLVERHITFTTLAAAPATVPYNCDFEQPGVNGWDLIQAGQNNYWIVGNATNNGGTKSLYITDNGTANSYSGTASYSFAVRTFNLAAGNYVCTYDWKCQGEGSYDFIRAALVPAGVNIEAGDYCGFDNASAMPAGSIALDGGYRLNLQGSTWQSQVTEFTLTSAGTYKIVFLWRNDGSVYNVPPAAIDNVQLMLNLCPMPQNITLTNLTQTSADVSWEEPGNATTWEYQLDNNTPVIAYDTFCTLTGLTANTVYSFHVRSICGQGDTGAWTTYNFRTPCGYMTVPYTQDFESEPTGSSSTGSAFANCWTRLNNGTSYGGYPYVSSSSTYNHTVGGSKGLYWYNSTTAGTYGDYQCVVLPPIDPAISIDSLQLSFWAKASSASYVPVFQIGVMTDPNNISTFVGVDTITITSGTTWMNFEVPLTAYTGTGSFIAVKADRPTSSWYAYVDDFFLDYVPTCLAPHNLHATASTTSSITIDWTDLSTASQWEVEYTGNGATNTTLASAHPYTLSNLPASTAYSIRVRAICGVGDTSYWTMAENAATECGLVTLPYVEDFENYTGTTYSTDGDLPVCWDGYSNGTTAAYFPHITGSGSYWYPHGGTNALTMTSGSATYGDTKIVVLPLFDQPMNTLSMTYWYKMENATNGSTLYVGYVTSPGYDTSFVPLKTVTSTTTLTRDSISFDTVPSTATNIAFKWYYNTSFYSVGIDDIEVTSSGAYCNAPTLLPVTDLSYNGATLNWNSNATEFEVAVKAATDAEYPEPTAVSNATSYAVSGLAPATLYRFHVRAVCDATENLVSDWIEGSFTTDSLPCFDPTALAVQSTGYTTVTLGWTANGEESAWRIRVWNTTFDETYDVTSNPATVTGLVSDVEYSAEVIAVCGGILESGVSNTVTFRTARCEAPTNVSTSNVTAHTAVVSWSGAASSYRVEYGTEGFGTGEGTSVTATGTTVTLTGLLDDQTYDVYVYAVCAEGLESAASQKHTFETTIEGIDIAGGMNVSIYPNPTTSATTVALSGVNGEVTITVVDMNGRIVMTESVSCDGDCVKRMEVEGLAQGAYFVRVSGENLNMVKKLVVK